MSLIRRTWYRPTPPTTRGSASRRSGWASTWAVAGLLMAIGGSGGPQATLAAAPDPEAVKFFESKVRPLLTESCTKCHGEAKHKGNLRLDSLPAILQGGDSGPAVVPGKL